MVELQSLIDWLSASSAVIVCFFITDNNGVTFVAFCDFLCYNLLIKTKEFCGLDLKTD